MADNKKMSVAEVLAACRRDDGQGGDDASPSSSEPAAVEKDQAPATPKKQPASPAAASGGSPQKMSVAEMLAAARGEKSGDSAKPETKKAPAASAKPATKPSAKPAAKPKAPAASSGPKDTASILAAARTAAKPGPISKAQAAAKGQSVAKGGKVKLAAPPMPVKPAYAKVAPQVQAEESRRGFLAGFMALMVGTPLAIGFTTFAATQLLWLLGLARFMFPNVLIEPPMKFKVGYPADFSPGQVETKYKAQFGVWIVRYEYEGVPQIYAIQSICTHLGCTPNWLEGEQKFKCPCHGSGFYKDGINFEGPAPRPLERFAIRMADDGQLEVDKSRKFQQELNQWEDPASYVPA